MNFDIHDSEAAWAFLLAVRGLHFENTGVRRLPMKQRFQVDMDYVLRKNAELYKRLAD